MSVTLTFNSSQAFTNSVYFILKKLLVVQLVRKFLAFYGTRRIIIVLTRARHLSLS